MILKSFTIALLSATIARCSENRSVSFVNFHTAENESCALNGESVSCNYDRFRNVQNETDVEVIFQNFESLRSDVNIVELWNNFPKILVPVNSADPDCRRDSLEFLRSLNKTELWAMQMFDSTAKLPSGILSGNIKQFGDFDECLGIVSPAKQGSSSIRGKYCLTELDMRLNKPVYEEFDNLIHSRDIIRSSMDDSPMIFPRFTTIDWAVCMPESCSAKDLQNELKQAFKGHSMAIRVQEEQCATKNIEQKTDLSNGKIFTVILFSTILILLVLGTVIDDNENIDEEESTGKRVLLAFSVPRNMAKIFRPAASSPSSVKAINGIRSIDSLCLLYVHKAIALLHQPYSNRIGMSEAFGQPWTVIARTGMYHTDSFLLLSGLLNAHALTGDLLSKGRIPIVNRIISRLFRILPSMMALILFCTYILPDLDSGPQWNLLIRQHAELCKDNMWKNVLFVQNYMGFNNICLPHTHQLGTDMQLFLVTPPVVWAIWKWPRRALTLVIIIAALSTVMRYVVTLQNRLSPMTYFGMPNSKFSETSDLSYTLPDHRATPYLIGVILGYFIKRGFNKLNMTKVQIRCCWFLAVVAMLLPIVLPHKIAVPNYIYSAHDAAMFSAFAPLTFGAFIAWTIAAANCGEAGRFGHILEWKGFKILSNLAYGIYLTQFPIFFYNIGRIRTPDHFSLGILIDIPELMQIILASAILAVCVEYPFLELRKIIFDNVKKKKIVSSKIETLCGVKDNENVELENKKENVIDKNK